MGPVLGAMFAVIIGMLSLPQLIDWQNRAKDNINATQVAQEARTFNTAGAQYMQANSAMLLATATATTPVIVSVAQLQTAGTLSATFRPSNMYGQTWQLEVKQPTAGNLQALATTTGGSALSDTQAQRIVKLIGSDGGFFPKNDTGLYAGGASNAHGPNWGPLASTGYSAQPGHFASLISLSSGQLTDNRLYRNAIPGQPQLNTMTTPLIMVATQIVGSTCIQIGALAQDGSGAVVSCQGSPGDGKWKAPGMYWKDPVTTYTALPTTDPIGTVRLTLDTNRAFAWNGTIWVALAIDQNGDLTVPGTATINALNGKLQITATAVEGASCVGEGRIAVSSTTSGVILSCQSGVWRKASGGTGLRGIFNPLALYQISCRANSTTAYAKVTADGTPYVRAKTPWGDTGWVQSTKLVRTFYGSVAVTSDLSLSTVALVVSSIDYNSSDESAFESYCTAYWPLS